MALGLDSCSHDGSPRSSGLAGRSESDRRAGDRNVPRPRHHGHPGIWSSELRHALTSRRGHDVGAYVTADQADQPVAVAVRIVDHRLRGQRRLTGHIGYVEWLATDERHRRRGAARMALNELLRWFEGLGVDTVDVHASN